MREFDERCFFVFLKCFSGRVLHEEFDMGV